MSAPHPAGGWRLWAPPGAYAAAIFALSSLPNPPAPPGAVTDKHLHALLYAGLALLVLRALTSADAGRVTVAVALVAAVIATAYGVTDELHQQFVPGRFADVRDLVANGVGAFMSTLVAWTTVRLKSRAGGRPSRASAEES